MDMGTDLRTDEGGDMGMLTEVDRDTLREMEAYFTRCVNNCTLGSQAYRRFSQYVFTLQRIAKIVKEDEHD